MLKENSIIDQKQPGNQGGGPRPGPGSAMQRRVVPWVNNRTAQLCEHRSQVVTVDGTENSSHLGELD